MTEPGLATPAAPTPAPQGDSGPSPPPTPRAPTRWMQRLAEETSPTPPSEDAVVTVPDESDADLDDAEPSAERPLGTGLLLVLGLFWLVAQMWSAHASIVDNSAAAPVMIGTAVFALPVVIAASLLAGAAAGLAGSTRFAKGGGGLRRAAVGVAAGALVGLASVGVILFAYGARPSVAILAITVGAAGALGGSAAAMRPSTLGAGIVATLGVFVVGVIVNYFQSPLKSLFGARGTPDAQLMAAHWLSFTAAAVSGLIAGLLAHFFLRRHAAAERWPAYLLAGATPGLLLLLAEGLFRVGGARLLGLVGALSENDRDVSDYLDAARINQALVVGFLGGIVAMIAVGRTLHRPDLP
jgi:hypothetical protein